MESQKLKVKVKVPKGDILEYEVSPSDTILSLQTKLKESQGLDEKDQYLGLFGGMYQALMDRSFLPHLTFEEALVKDGDTLYLSVRKGGYRLFIKTLDGQALELDTDVYDLIWNIKVLIQEQTGFPVEKQRVIFAGKQLEDHRGVAEYGIQKDSTLHLILK